MTPKNPEVVQVIEEADVISCNGGGGVHGHPTVFYSFGLKRSVTCGYCGRVFVKSVKNAA